MPGISCFVFLFLDGKLNVNARVFIGFVLMCGIAFCVLRYKAKPHGGIRPYCRYLKLQWSARRSRRSGRPPPNSTTRSDLEMTVLPPKYRK